MRARHSGLLVAALALAAAVSLRAQTAPATVFWRKDVLAEATEILEEPSKNTKRKILVSLNLIIALVGSLHILLQLVTLGRLPDPARVKAILVRDEEDVASGDPLIELEPA